MRFIGRGAWVLGAVALAWAPSAVPAMAGDAAAGSKKIAACSVCHGRDGHAKIPEAPNLAGQNEQYLIASLNAYKSGARKNDMMSLIAPSLSDQYIADVAAYFSALGCKP